MDQNNINKNDSSLLKNESIINEKEKIRLPVIKKELIPFQNNVRVNKICQCEKNNFSKLKLNLPTFLTSQKYEIEKLKLNTSNNKLNINKEEEKIFKLLKEKIEISPIKRDKYCHKNIRSYNKLNTYINEASLLKNSRFVYIENKNLKQMKVGRLFTLSNTFKKINCNNEDSNNKNTLDLRIYKNIYDIDDKSKRLKTLDKRNSKNEISGYIKNNWRKNFNCALRYRFNKNKKSIDEITYKIKEINNVSKETFNGFQKETDDIFDEAMNIKDNKKKKKFRFQK